jgi:hypothetical protein
VDWVKRGFGDDLSLFDEKLPFVLDYNGALFSPESADFLIKQAISRIVDAYPPPYTLMCSGGVDSQAMVLAWKLSGFPFNIVCARYNGGMNDPDLSELWSLAVREELDIEVMDLDLLSFHEHHLREWATRYTCHSPHIISHMFIASQIKRGTVISSGTFVTSGGGLFGAMNYSIFGLDRYSERSGQPMVPYFFNHDRELMPVFDRIARDAGIETVGDISEDYYTRKCQIFQEAGLNVIPQSHKMHGFEKIKEHCDSYAVESKSRFRYRTKVSDRPYDLLYRYPLEDAVPYSHYKKTVFDINSLADHVTTS